MPWVKQAYLMHAHECMVRGWCRDSNRAADRDEQSHLGPNSSIPAVRHPAPERALTLHAERLLQVSPVSKRMLDAGG